MPVKKTFYCPPLHIPAYTQEVYDVTGAGDTVISVVALAMASGSDMYSSAMIANIAAGLVVMKLGTATVSADELRHAVNGGRA